MLVKTILCLLILLFTLLSGESNAQETGTLRGTVLDSLSEEALPFANIVLENTLIGASTDANGYFVITGIPPNTYSVKVSFVGYKAKTLKAEIKPGEITQMRIFLSSSEIQMEAIEKIGEKYKNPNETDWGCRKWIYAKSNLYQKELRQIYYDPCSLFRVCNLRVMLQQDITFAEAAVIKILFFIMV